MFWKPCPFCGSSAVLVKEALNGYPGELEIYMKCCSPYCGATVPAGHYTTLRNSIEEAEKKAIKIWNEREDFRSE